MYPKRIWKDELLKALNIYQNELADFIYKPITPAMISRMEDKIESVRQRYRAIDRNYVWDVKIEIVPTGYGAFELRPVLEDANFYLEEKPRIPF